ncbi:SRPBCC family protein [Nonomuraea sp. LPB2021202275-12-8]|uniref:SRPBCC family protein n=1 Tax=Nonomuraea sp. LPB2021202275-12-8 TaxID=3120159 RepID=UPI00300DA76F
MSTIEHSVDVNVPVRVAYNQWTQFESFPEFMEGVESIKQVTDTRTHWITEIAGVKREFEAEITEQHPDERIAWRSIDKPHQAGVVTFHHINPETTRVTLQMEYDPEGFVEKAGDWLQIVKLRIRNDMERFKSFIESRGSETGGWRGDVPGAHQPGSGLGVSDDPVPPGTIGGTGFPQEGTLPPPGPVPPRNDPPQGPRPVL